MKHLLLCAGALAASLTAGAAMAARTGPVITVTPSVAPNAFGSPSWAGYVANAVGALHDGDTSRGDPNSPTFYKAQSNVNANQVVVTGFPSWLGQQNPGAVFGPAYANEAGNRMMFGVTIDGGGLQFSISELRFSAVSNDPGDVLGFSFGAGEFDYSPDYEGVLKGADGLLWTSDDVFITGGPNTQLVDGLVGRGSGNSEEATCAEGPCVTEAERQALIDAAAGRTGQASEFTGTYSIGDFSGSGTFDITAGGVPEPATWAMMILGLGGAGAMLRRRRSVMATA